MVGPGELEELVALPLLEGADTEQVRALAGCMSLGQAAPGEVLGREGEPGEVFWLLLSGRVEVTVGAPSGEVVLAVAGPGSILGELALLRHGPRTATVKVLESCRYLCGGADAMEQLLAIEPALRRMKRLASSRLAEDARPVPLTLRDGAVVHMRPLLHSDRPTLDSALRNMSRESIRRRFFSAATPSSRLLDYLLDIDYVDHFAWAVIDPATSDGLGVGRYIRQPGTASAEMAFATVDSMQGRGIGTFLLGGLGVAAREAGLRELDAYVMEENRPMRAVFAKAGGLTRYDEQGVVLVTVDPVRAAALLEPALQAAIASAVRDVVTAASLVLT